MALSLNLKKKVEKYLIEVQKQQIHILKAYLFGSYTKGTVRKDSDIDIISPDFSGTRYFRFFKNHTTPQKDSFKN